MHLQNPNFGVRFNFFRGVYISSICAYIFAIIFSCLSFCNYIYAPMFSRAFYALNFCPPHGAYAAACSLTDLIKSIISFGIKAEIKMRVVLFYFFQSQPRYQPHGRQVLLETSGSDVFCFQYVLYIIF